ncbi:hypothetical protein [Caldimonas tepidiphila]|uniref:hypothetical protein n=1 Tax=Caldimonas tepidiphila TaxID=2315841 RepID=UPI0013002B30|nr:hypothetical protein [Caldimonas tepidiphila]
MALSDPLLRELLDGTLQLRCLHLDTMPALSASHRVEKRLKRRPSGNVSQPNNITFHCGGKSCTFSG